MTTEAGETEVIDFKFAPFDPEAYHGTANAEIALLRSDGAPAAGKSMKVEWFDGHYGSIKVLEETVPEDGIVKLEACQLPIPRAAPWARTPSAWRENESASSA